MIYTVTFNPSVDYTIYIDEVIPGITNRSGSEEIHFGGKGINVSCVLAELGVSSVTLGFVAGFTGRALENSLIERGITSRFIHLTDGFSRINIKIKTHTETEINCNGPYIPPEALRQFMVYLEQLTAEDTLMLTGSIPSSLPQNTYEKILQSVSGNNIRCIVDASGQLLMSTLKYKPFLIKPNKQELEEIFSVKINSQSDILKYGSQLQAMGAENVLISLGECGAVLIDEYGNTHICPAVKCNVISTVGAGDSMLAGFVSEYDRTRDFSAALKLGAVCGAATASLSGLATKQRISELMI